MIPCDNCGRRLRSTYLSETHCPTCFYALRTLQEEGAETFADLAEVLPDELIGRVADVLRRSGVEDAERLIRGLERLRA